MRDTRGRAGFLPDNWANQVHAAIQDPQRVIEQQKIDAAVEKVKAAKERLRALLAQSE